MNLRTLRRRLEIVETCLDLVESDYWLSGSTLRDELLKDATTIAKHLQDLETTTYAELKSNPIGTSHRPSHRQGP